MLASGSVPSALVRLAYAASGLRARFLADHGVAAGGSDACPGAVAWSIAWPVQRAAPRRGFARSAGHVFAATCQRPAAHDAVADPPTADPDFAAPTTQARERRSAGTTSVERRIPCNG